MSPFPFQSFSLMRIAWWLGLRFGLRFGFVCQLLNSESHTRHGSSVAKTWARTHTLTVALYCPQNQWTRCASMWACRDGDEGREHCTRLTLHQTLFSSFLLLLLFWFVLSPALFCTLFACAADSLLLCHNFVSNFRRIKWRNDNNKIETHSHTHLFSFSLYLSVARLPTLKTAHNCVRLSISVQSVFARSAHMWRLSVCVWSRCDVRRLVCTKNFKSVFFSFS